jgi:DNA-binding NtrC family response regulator
MMQTERMQLIADRFVTAREGPGFALDLATDEPVWLEIDSAGEPSEFQRWLSRCDRLFRIRHPALAVLVDYGALGSADRFEAWACRERYVERSPLAWKVQQAARAFLLRNGLTVGDGGAAIVDAKGDLRVVMSPESGYDNNVATCRTSCVPGLVLVDRPALTAVCELVRESGPSAPRATMLRGTRHSGLTTALLALAREARINGFVPTARTALVRHEILLRGRSLMVIDPNPQGSSLSRWLDHVLRSGGPHLYVAAGSDDIPGLCGVSLGRLVPASLVDAMCPKPADASRTHWEIIARRSAGLPGVFARALWSTNSRYRLDRRKPTRVAEQGAVYGSGVATDGGGPVVVTTPATVGWRPAADVAALNRQLTEASLLLTKGRHAPGLRLLRHTVAAFARRDAWPETCAGAKLLASALLDRGRPRDALKVLELPRRGTTESADAAPLIEISRLTANAWIDLARLDEAERVLRAALVTARAEGNAAAASDLADVLARCFFWRGEFTDGLHVLQAAAKPSCILSRSRRHRITARLAVALGDSSTALAAAAQAQAVADRDGSVLLRTYALNTSAFVKLVVGDLAAAEADGMGAVVLARTARAPMQALSALLLHAEAVRRAGRSLSPRALARLRRLASTAPPLLRSRWTMFEALVNAAPADGHSISCRHASVAGLPALRLFGQPARAKATGVESVVDDVVHIMQICQQSEDETGLLKDICAAVRARLGAVASCFVASAPTGCAFLVGDGARMECDVGARAIGADLFIAPHTIDARVEAAAPVRFGGKPIAALCARWTLATDEDRLARANMLTLAAAAAAPLVFAALTRRSAAAVSPGADLIGITPVIEEVRRLIACAAPAPFAVLVEGESGSGKELVARAIHRGGPRRDRPFCTLNCAALPDDLVEAELFGHARGAFTGAVAERPGVFEEAHGGTLFLDEVGELSLRAQAKLLRVIQEGELRRVGENVARRVDVRIVSATNRDLRRETEGGRFRLDLLYRLDVVRIHMPPLRERREDIALFVDHFWADAARRTGSHAVLSSSTRATLAAHDWPGNVRELQNVLSALAVRCPRRGIVQPAALPPHLSNAIRPASCRLEEARRTFEETFIRAALVRTGGHRARAAAELGVTRQGLAKLISRLGIE